MVFNQMYIPDWNTLYPVIVNKITKTIISANIYTSPFTSMLQNLETGDTVEDIHINPGHILLHDTVTNSDIFTNYIDDLATAYYKVNVDLQYPSTYREYVVREGMTMLENVSALISAIVANIRVTLEYHRTNLVKQMLYNAYQYGMLSSITISDPRLSRRTSGKFAVAMNTMIDDFWTEINPRNVIYNNQVGLAAEDQRLTIGKEFPYILLFNDYIRDVEFENAINLALIERFRTGDSNQDWMSKIIRLNRQDFPTSIPQIDRNTVTGDNVSATNINFYPMPTDESGNNLFSGTPTGGDTILAIMFEPEALQLYTQLTIATKWMNPATLYETNREIYRGIMELAAFRKICVITCNDGQYIPEDDPLTIGVDSETITDGRTVIPETTEA